MKPQLFLLHFAGGNRYSYQFLIPFLPTFEVIPLELPGRGKRIGESLLKDFSAASRDYCKQITAQVKNSGFFIYGHSMGALLALKVTSMFEKEGMFPGGLFVSGSAGPDKSTNKNRHLLSREEFVKELKIMGGMPPGFLDDPELLDLFEPILRADFEIIEKSQNQVSPVQAPLYAIMGKDEDNVNEITAWRHFTASQFQYEILEGGHFFIYQHARRLSEIFAALKADTVDR